MQYKKIKFDYDLRTQSGFMILSDGRKIPVSVKKNSPKPFVSSYIAGYGLDLI